ncbi:MAG: CoA-binding protein [Bacteroidetes bacterium]|jgi:predicted CoA-binding protein|nr:CoA-binding protein [Bacteroidota bacterium]MDF2452281.1 CoA-binding protein [Bacteroidota bacterium]
MSKNKTTVVIGASPSPERYSFKATFSLHKHGHTVYPVGLRNGTIHDVDIITDRPAIEDVDTVTLYVGPAHQHAWTDYILSLKPKRIIFNPGTENAEFESLAESKGIQTLHACTLVMLAIKEY